MIRKLNEEKISINKAYQETKAKLEAAEKLVESERKRAEELEKRLTELQGKMPGDSGEAEEMRRTVERLRSELVNLKNRKPETIEKVVEKIVPEVVEKVVEKVVFKPDPAQETALEAAREEAKRLADELQKVLKDREYYQSSIESIKKEKERLEKRLEHLEIGAKTAGQIKEKTLPVPLKSELDRIGSLSTDLLLLMDRVLSRSICICVVWVFFFSLVNS
ncbi:MAG: hypothetical protein K6T80_08465 [Firmicutes bacterium]|nr:hypothetical protein [Bacillota bacterium]